MIDIKEIRIGNWFNYDGVNFQFELIHFKAILDGKLILENLHPIILDEEKLVKLLQFVKTTFSYNYLLVPSDEIMEFEGSYLLTINKNEYNIGNTIKYVHQLQNIYFDLYNITF